MNRLSWPKGPASNSICRVRMPSQAIPASSKASIPPCRESRPRNRIAFMESFASKHRTGHTVVTVVPPSSSSKTATLHWAPGAPPELAIRPVPLALLLKRPAICVMKQDISSHTHGSRKTVSKWLPSGAPHLAAVFMTNPSRPDSNRNSALRGNQQQGTKAMQHYKSLAPTVW